MTTLVLNTELLAVLCALKAKMKLAICEGVLPCYPQNWLLELESYFHSMPDGLIRSVGLKKNRFCLDAIVSLSIPDEWLSASSSELKQFHFSY